MSEVKLFLGDCLEIMASMPERSIDVIFADPPYNVGKDYGNYDDRMKPDDYLAWCKAWFSECKRLSRSCIVITPAMVNVPMWQADIERTHYIIAWTKQNNCSRNYIGPTSGFQTWEPILVYGKSKKTILRDSVDVPIRIQTDARGHPCPKPLPLLAWVVVQFATEGDTWLDPFMGSGTTGVACTQTNRNFIGIEINPDYFKIAERRIREAQAQLMLPEPEAQP